LSKFRGEMMKSFAMAGLAAAIVLAVGAGSMSAQVTTWKIDPMHSESDFAIKHMAINTVHGSFRGVSGVITLDEKNLSKSGVEATIDVTTVDTGVAQRDGHLKSPDFFDVAKFPTMTFKSTGVTKAGDHFDVAGLLTIHGVTKPVVLSLEALAKPQTMDGKSLHRGFTATTVINRQDFGLIWNGPLQSGDKVLGDQVKIELDIEAIQQ
jgi:polyisoprenoid-binding protein YceI